MGENKGNPGGRRAGGKKPFGRSKGFKRRDRAVIARGVPRVSPAEPRSRQGPRGRLGSTLGQNLSNVRRKPSARRTSPLKKLMRRQTISPKLAQEMEGRPEKGDRRRTVAQRELFRKTRARGATG